MKKNMQSSYAEYKYTVNNQDGFDLTTALRLWKTKYQDDIRDFHKDVITHDQLQDFGYFVEECWNRIEPFTVEDALKIANVEQRRTYFDAIGIEKLFKALDPKLLDRQVIKKSRTKWDDEFKEYKYEFEDIYELYEIDGKKLYDKDRWGNDPQPIYAVRCWCTTTNREYWLYVPREAALGDRWWWFEDKKAGPTPDAIRAIAWTVRIDVELENVDKIYRQGDIIVVKMKDKAKSSEHTIRPYHLEKNDYLSLMYSET
jgi:hypothetical protein